MRAPLLVAASLPRFDLADEHRLRRDAAVEALGDHHADLDLDHVQPAGVLRRVVELESAEDAAGLSGSNVS